MSKDSSPHSADAVTNNDDIAVSGTYQQLHKPSSSFASRDDYLNHELQIMQPKRWKPKLPFRD